MHNSHFTTVLDVRRGRSDERVATAKCKLRISPQFWRSDQQEVTRGLRRRRQNSHFTTVLDVRRARSDERAVSRLGQPNLPCVKKRKKFQRSLDPQPFSADLLSRSSQHSHSQQIFSADLQILLAQPCRPDSPKDRYGEGIPGHTLYEFCQACDEWHALNRCSWRRHR